jgi:hypothetical protein
LVDVKQFDIVQTGPVCLADQALQDGQLVLGGADVEIAGSSQLRV